MPPERQARRAPARESTSPRRRPPRAATPSACRLRTASIIVSTLPASTPSGPRTVPSCTCTSRLPRLYGAVVQPGGRDRVGDERHPLAAPRARRPSRRLGREMDAVEDDRHDDVVARERRADDARVAVQERAHRVEEVGDAARAAVERGVRLLGGRVACGRARRSTPRSSRRSISASAPGELGRERHQPHGPAVEQPLEQRRGRGRAAPRLRACRAGSARGTAPRGACPRMRGRALADRHLAHRGERAAPRGS